jgi:quercetin dioxygenase-like cupin family protein
MIKGKLAKMVKGWFVGNFEPTIYRTNDVEVAVKDYKAGDREAWHFHKLATEITVILSGQVRMAGEEHRAGDIVLLSPGEGSAFEVLEDARTVVVKIPGANNDKYFAGE